MKTPLIIILLTIIILTLAIIGIQHTRETDLLGRLTENIDEYLLKDQQETEEIILVTGKMLSRLNDRIDEIDARLETIETQK